MVFTPNDDPMQINKTRFKLGIKQRKQCRRVNNLCLYCGKLGHIASACPKKCVQHVVHATISTITQGSKKKGNEDI